MERLERVVATLPIVLYQKTLSPDHGAMSVFYPHGFCPFFPSCSEYARQAIIKNGVVCGVCKGALRVLRCHPWTRGGIDTP